MWFLFVGATKHVSNASPTLDTDETLPMPDTCQIIVVKNAFQPFNLFF